MARAKKADTPCCDRHPYCEADKCVCFTKCLAQICECGGEKDKSYED